MLATSETTLPLPGLSPVNGKTVSARFDGGSLSSDAGLLGLREVERRLDVAGRLAACIDDPRDPARTLHSAADILRFRMLMIAAGYENGIDANALRADPVFKMAPVFQNETCLSTAYSVAGRNDRCWPFASVLPAHRHGWS
jgi:hypothetical protein